MKYVAVESSNIDAVGYDEASSILGIQFKGGSEYEYYAVPKAVYDGLLSASSVGGYFHQNVKEAGYRYRKVR